HAAGWRAAAANLSDLAAMGAQPLALTISLSLPREQSVAWVLELYRGLTACCQRYGAVVAGGDLSRSPTVRSPSPPSAASLPLRPYAVRRPNPEMQLSRRAGTEPRAPV
ncbi:MAG: hypothetical protein HC838_16335, partial [Spirulinaceae cyanobacterium RM2_2_10]|nr:hypothetical protein [Spirulinaceae cyanobacterium RM2_2_10]